MNTPNRITIECCPKHKEWYSQDCSNCMAETMDKEFADFLDSITELPFFEFVLQVKEKAKKLRGEL